MRRGKVRKVSLDDCLALCNGLNVKSWQERLDSLLRDRSTRVVGVHAQSARFVVASPDFLTYIVLSPCHPVKSTDLNVGLSCFGRVTIGVYFGAVLGRSLNGMLVLGIMSVYGLSSFGCSVAKSENHVLMILLRSALVSTANAGNHEVIRFCPDPPQWCT